MNLATLRSDIAAALFPTGIKIATDPRNAQAPCVLVGPIVSVETAGHCAWEVEIPVWLIAPAPGDQKAVDWLAAHITDVMKWLPEVSSTALGTYNVGQGDLPAYEITVTMVAKE